MVGNMDESKSQRQNYYDVVIAGAGMVGASIGCALGQAGLRVALIDPVPPVPYNSTSAPSLRVSALSPATIHFLETLSAQDHISAWDHIKAMRLCPYRRMAVWERLYEPFSRKPLSSRFNQTLFDCSEVETTELGFIVENQITQQALHLVLGSLTNVDLIFSQPVAIKRESDQVGVELESGNATIYSRLLVGADGANSFVRQSCHMRMVSEGYEQQALVATVEISTGPLDITWQAFTATGPLALLPLPSCDGKNYASLVWYNLPENICRLMSLPETEFISEVRRHFPQEELPEIEALVERGSFPLTRRQTSSYIKERVVLVGDAAHTINPLAGQGVNLGFQDAAVLSQLLVSAHKSQQDIGNLSLLSRYEQQRRPENIRMQRVMDLFYHLFSNEHLPLKVVRNLGLAFAGNFAYGRRKVMRYAMGLDSTHLKSVHR